LRGCTRELPPSHRARVSGVSGSRIANPEYSSRDWLSQDETPRLVIQVTMIHDPKIHLLTSTDIVILEE